MLRAVMLAVVVAGLGAKSVTKSGLQVEVTKQAGCKDTRKAADGDKVTVHYGGFLQDGEEQWIKTLSFSVKHVKEMPSLPLSMCLVS